MLRQLTSRHVFVAAGAVVLAGTLLVLSVPRTIAALKAMPAERILDSIANGRSVDAATVARLLQSLDAASAWRDRGRDLADRALGELLLVDPADADGVSPSDRATIEQAIRDLTASLSRSPLNPHAWTRLAYARMLLDGPSDAAAASLMMSVYLGPHDPQLVFPRLGLLFRVWDRLADDERRLAYRQIQFAWEASDVGLARLAVRTRRYKDIRLAMLQVGPQTLAGFETVLHWVLAGEPKDEESEGSETENDEDGGEDDQSNDRDDESDEVRPRD